MNEVVKVEAQEVDVLGADQGKLDAAALSLPTYNEITEERVVKEMQAVFKGFEYNSAEDVTANFKDADQLINFIKEGNEELRQIDLSFKRSYISNSGAIMAKRWFYGYVIDKCMSKAAKGAGAAEKLRTAAGISTAYLYQYRRVGAKLKITDAYILGMYGAGWDSVRELATIDDDRSRSLAIKYFVDTITDFNNKLTMERARAGLREYIRRVKGQDVEIDSTDIKQIEAKNNLADIAPNVAYTMKMLNKLDSALKTISKEAFIDQVVNAFADFNIQDDLPMADKFLSEIRDTCDSVLSKIEAVQNMLPDVKEAVISLSNVELTKSEEAVEAEVK